MTSQIDPSGIAEVSECPECGYTSISVLARETKSGSVTLGNRVGFAGMYLGTIHETSIVAAECHECDTLLVEDEEWVYDEG